MTILINGTVDFSPEDAVGAVSAAAELLAATRKQPGCRHYVWSLDPAVPGRVYVYENWETESALAEHLAGAFYRELLTLLSDFHMRASNTLKYRVDVTGPVHDKTGKARADFFETVQE